MTIRRSVDELDGAARSPIFSIIDRTLRFQFLLCCTFDLGLGILLLNLREKLIERVFHLSLRENERLGLGGLRELLATGYAMARRNGDLEVVDWDAQTAHQATMSGDIFVLVSFALGHELRASAATRERVFDRLVHFLWFQ